MKTYMKSRCKCTTCDKRFSTRRGLHFHYNMVHLNITPPKKERHDEPYQRLEGKDNTNEAR